MCGITGFWDPAGGNEILLQETVLRMAQTISHRGPDDFGHWSDTETGLALGFRRLSIIDLSPTGHQPMFSSDERFVIVFNGEIYNFLTLRKELASYGHRFHGTSDTEVLLAAICQWGLKIALSRLNGMFAFALWDRRERQLHLVRDRLGVKPLYYGWIGGTFLFGSELKPLQAHPAFQTEINRDALTLYLRHNYVPAPYSIFKGIHKLPPGCLLTLNSANTSQKASPLPYWSAEEIVEQGIANPLQCSDQEAIQALDSLLREGIQNRMISDVPLGAFLSGGVDSSNVVAIMQAISNRPVKTFTIGFHESAFNEAGYAAAVANHLGTDHTELYITHQEALAVIPRLPTLYDEPFADPSQIPTFLVSELARQHVTVSLSGDGGDELFAGYDRYSWGQRIWQTTGWIPGPLRGAFFTPLSTIHPNTWSKLLKAVNPLVSKTTLSYNIPDRIQKLLEIMAANSRGNLYRQLVSLWKCPEKLVIHGNDPNTVFTNPGPGSKLSFMQWMMYIDLITYLPDDILVKIDRASMGVSLEARVPYLDDHRVAEFAWRLPMSMKVRNGQTKWLLRQVLYQYVPPKLIERPKMGFGVPIDTWLRGPLRDWAEDLLSESLLRDQGFFDPALIRHTWDEHLQGIRDWKYHLWTVLMFQAWLKSQG